MANGFALSRRTRICSVAAPVLAATSGYADELCDSDPGRKDLVHSQVWRMILCNFLMNEGGQGDLPLWTNLH